MIRKRYNDDWKVKTASDSFVLGGGEEKAVTLPHDAMRERERDPDTGNGSKTGFYPGGTYHYTKKLFAPAEYEDQAVALEFEGVYMNAMVYVNGDYAGQRPYGYSNFYIPLNPYLRYGADNEIKVVAQSSSQSDSRWYTGTGVHRNVSLLTGGLVHVEPDGLKIAVTDIEAEQAVAEVSVTIRNDGHRNGDTVVAVEITDANGAVVAADSSPFTAFAGKTGVQRSRLLIPRPSLWSADTPVLYGCRVAVTSGDLELDRDAASFGIRKLQLDRNHGLRINGESVKLRGACIHHDNGVIGARAIERAEERRVEILKKAGFNAIRSAHHPMSKALLDACDRIGMLVMDETFDVWCSTKSHYDYANYFADWWERDVEAMIHKDYNHPSVILYSIGNEIPETGSRSGAAWGRKIAGKIRSLDDTRFTINSVNGMLSVMDKIMSAQNHQSGEDTGEINSMMSDMVGAMSKIMTLEIVGSATEESFQAVDVAGYNYMDARYRGDGELFPNRIICGSETFPADIDTNWRLVKDLGYVIGDFTWTGWDYLGEAGIGKVEYDASGGGIYGDYPWVIAYCGDMDIIGDRRPQSYYREIVWGLRGSPYLAVQRPAHYGMKPAVTPWSWSDSIASWTWPGCEGKPAVVEVYSDADEVELTVNGVSMGKKPAGEANRFKALFDIAYDPGELTAIAYRGGAEISRHSLRTSEALSAIQVKTDRDTLCSQSGDLAYAEISLTDGNGILYTAGDREVTVKVEGAGELLGVGSADPKSTIPYTGFSTKTFDGRALAVVRPTGEGNIAVTASCDGCTSHSVNLTSRIF